MGRLAVRTDEEYVKTTKKLVMDAQAEIAERVKIHGLKRDLLDEEEVMRGLEQRLRDRGVKEELISQQLRRLRFHQKAHREGMVGALEESTLRSEGWERPPTSPVDEPGEIDLEEWEVEGPDEMMEIGNGTYVMSLVGRSKKRTLHQIGGCYRRPGIDYKDYVVLGNVRPELKMGEKLCGTCFGARDKAVSEAASEPEDVVVSDESSSSELLTSDPDEGLSDLDI